MNAIDLARYASAKPALSEPTPLFQEPGHAVYWLVLLCQIHSNALADRRA
jgi:hypothetical protein